MVSLIVIKIKIFHSCRTRVSPVLHPCRLCCTRLALMLLVPGTRVVKKLDQNNFSLYKVQIENFDSKTR